MPFSDKTQLTLTQGIVQYDPQNGQADALFFDGHGLVMHAIGLSTDPSAILTLKRMEPRTNAPTTVLSITKNGRLLADFSSSARLRFQTSAADQNTYLSAIPNGTGRLSGFFAYDASDAGSGFVGIFTDGVVNTIWNGNNGGGPTSPLDIWMDGSGKVRFHVSGGVSIGDTTDPGAGVLRVANGLVLPSLPAFAASDKYVTIDASGNLHKSAIGPAS